MTTTTGGSPANAVMLEQLSTIVGTGPRRAGDPSGAVAELLSSSGLVSLCLPARLGGGGAGLLTLVDAVESVATVDASVAWCLFITATAPWLLAHADTWAVEEVYVNPGARIAGALAPTGTAQRDGDDFVVNGRWAFGSGVSTCHWLAVHVRLVGEDDSAFALVPADAVAYREPWDGLGLWGTGSGAFGIEDARVPPHRMIRRLDGAASWDEEPFRLPFRATFAAAAAVLLGLAAGALHSFVELASAKTPTFGRRRLADDPRVQLLVSDLTGELLAARASLRASVQLLCKSVVEGKADDLLRAQLRVAVNHARRASIHVIDGVHGAAGSTAIDGSSIFARALRDVHTAGQHYLFSDEIGELAGSVILGNPADEARL